MNHARFRDNQSASQLCGELANRSVLELSLATNEAHIV